MTIHERITQAVAAAAGEHMRGWPAGQRLTVTDAEAIVAKAWPAIEPALEAELQPIEKALASRRRAAAISPAIIAKLAEVHSRLADVEKNVYRGTRTSLGGQDDRRPISIWKGVLH